MANGTIIQVGNSTRIWELNLKWPYDSQCGVWDAKKPGVDVWQCIKARECRLSPWSPQMPNLPLQMNPSQVPNLPIRCIGNTLHVGSMEPHSLFPIPNAHRFPPPLVLASGPSAGESTQHAYRHDYLLDPNTSVAPFWPLRNQSIKQQARTPRLEAPECRASNCDKMHSAIALPHTQKWATIVFGRILGGYFTSFHIHNVCFFTCWIMCLHLVPFKMVFLLGSHDILHRKRLSW